MLTPENFMSIWIKIIDEKEEKVCLVYLANEIVIKSDFRNVFKVQIATKFVDLMKQESTLQKDKQSIIKVVNTWRDRNLFDT
jgi:hypothetical protein